MSNKKEIWKNIKECDDYYQVSSYGRVRELPRIIHHYDGNGKTKTNKSIATQRLPLRLKKLKIKKDGYLGADMRINGECKHFLVHRLVAKAFIPNPHHLPEVNHKDENPKNNHVDNLEWCSRRYNCNYGNRTPKMHLHNIEIESHSLNKKLLTTHDIKTIHKIASIIRQLHCLK